MDMFLSPQTIVESGRGYYKLYQNIIRVEMQEYYNIRKTL